MQPQLLISNQQMGSEVRPADVVTGLKHVMITFLTSSTAKIEELLIWAFWQNTDKPKAWGKYLETHHFGAYIESVVKREHQLFSPNKTKIS